MTTGRMGSSTMADVVTGARTFLTRNTARIWNGAKYLRGDDFGSPCVTPKDTVWRQGKVELWRYRNDSVSVHPPVLLILGLVSRSTLFDLHEKASLVGALRDAGFDVYILDWGVADAGDAKNRLETYVSRYLPRAVRALLRTSGADDFSLIGYCMGGNLALLAAASHPELPIRNLVTMATSVDWDSLHPQLDPLRRPGERAGAFVNDDGVVPGELIAYFFKVRKPTADLLQVVSLWRMLWNPSYVAGHQAIARWASDHVPVPRLVAEQILDEWLRQNGFMTGHLRLNGRAVDLKAIVCPMLAILTTKDEIVPPAAARPIGDLVGSTDVEVLELEAGHIGLSVGRSAHQVMYPRLISWLKKHEAA
ncbi:MAG: polyhydroxyalkanoate synthase [Rhodococcus sp. (in: high G+C Gram-positive bacteria)]